MYAHQVIKDLKIACNYIKSDATTSFYKIHMEKSIEGIQKSFKFHLGDMTQVIYSFEGLLGKRIFMENSEFIRLPYKICWFDYTHSCVEDLGNEIACPKRGILTIELSTNIFTVNIFDYAKSINHWLAEPATFLIKIGSNLKNDDIKDLLQKVFHNIPFNKIVENSQTLKQIESFMNGFTKIEETNNIMPIFIPMGDKIRPIQDITKFIDEDVGDLTCLNTALLLLNCKNISREKIIAPLKLNSKRIKEKKEPLYDYHILKLSFPNESIKYFGNQCQSETHNRLHFVRGHFKKYTEQHPLFGKISGLWFWQAHLAGKTKAFLDKDYEIKQNKENKDETISFTN